MIRQQLHVLTIPAVHSDGSGLPPTSASLWVAEPLWERFSVHPAGARRDDRGSQNGGRSTQKQAEVPKRTEISAIWP